MMLNLSKYNRYLNNFNCNVLKGLEAKAKNTVNKFVFYSAM
jgi:hypothetical protein